MALHHTLNRFNAETRLEAKLFLKIEDSGGREDPGMDKMASWANLSFFNVLMLWMDLISERIVPK